ncbi:DUF6705 family protein [uncultured Psychroserpens sp.]|uniref:DUF6705 family protein n=1 Tax=uncultured Psychroserpens sp. TaxID=255436 RepID=UPI00260FB037|nr:DUF6705 family protein [uncultured Psychroserpens sp.]
MKTHLITLIFIISFCSCKAQSPIVDIESSSEGLPTGAYFKDNLNKLGKFAGTWTYTNGNTSFTIQLVKIEQYHQREGQGKFFEDVLIGEYKYVENGIEIINTLSNINNTSINPYSHLISGNIIAARKNSFTPCEDCSPDEKRAALSIRDPLRDYLTSHRIILRYINDQEITATIVATHGVMINEGDPIELRVPNGEYTMIKQ